jgi:hypothetical protein
MRSSAAVKPGQHSESRQILTEILHLSIAILAAAQLPNYRVEVTI